MTELDEAWELTLAEAKRRAHAAGRADIADYLNLRARNDLLRRTGTEWLVSSLTKLAGGIKRRGAGIQIQQQDAHRFLGRSSTIGGTTQTPPNRLGALIVANRRTLHPPDRSDSV